MYDDISIDEANQDAAMDMLTCDISDIDAIYEDYISRKERMGPSMSTYAVSY